MDMKENVYQIKTYFSNQSDFNYSPLFDIDIVFNKAIEFFSQQTEEENLNALVKSCLSPIGYSKTIIRDCADNLFSEKQKEFSFEEDKLEEIEEIYYNFENLLKDFSAESKE